MMDTLIEQKKGFKKKYISYVIAGLLLTLAAGWLFFVIGPVGYMWIGTH